MLPEKWFKRPPPKRHTCFPKSGSSGHPEKFHMLPEKCETVFGQEACNKEVRFSVKSRESEKTTIFL